jgi:hypothetical protein
MALATVASTLSGTLSNLATTGLIASRYAAEGKDVLPVVLRGGAESLAPLILGFALLTVTALVTAVGLRRHGAAEAHEVRPAPALTR